MAAAALTKEQKLKRLIYLNNIEAKYISGDPDKHRKCTKEKLSLVDKFLAAPLDEFLNILLAANQDRLIPYRSNLLYILVITLKARLMQEKFKPKIMATVLNICNSDEEFFNFIRYISTAEVHRKLPPTVGKTIRKYYNGKTPRVLVESYVKHTSYHSWSHKDLIKLGHVKSDTPLKNVVVSYILRKTSNDREEGSEDGALLNILQNCDALRKATDHNVAIPLITELRATIDHIQPSLRRSVEVWNAVLPNMSVPEVLESLMKLYRLGSLKRDTPTQLLVIQALTDTEKVRRSNVHPLEVFIHMKTFEKGGKPLDPKLINHLVLDRNLNDEQLKKAKVRYNARCPAVIQNLQRCIDISYGNLQPTGKRYLVTIDVTNKMELPCMHNRSITALEAAVAFTTALLKVEKDVLVAVYRQREISILYLERREQFSEQIQMFKRTPSEYLVPAAPMLWAISQKRHIDVFINFIHHHEYYVAVPRHVRERVPKPANALQRYRNKVNLQNAKLITWCLCSSKLNFSDGTPNILDVAGLDTAVPRVIEAFCRGNFC